MPNNEDYVSSNFIHNIIDKDIAQRTYGERPIYTRFPPEPNGYLHIGHAKSICLNFSTAQKYGGKCNLRFDDTNPVKEDTEYVDSIESDVKWLGYQWDELLYASDYFDKMYEFAILLIKKDKAFVCDLSAEEIKNHRGTLTEPGKYSPYRGRTIEENLDLFERMKNGEFEDGKKVLRAKIDMNSPNINMRDPVIYRIAHAEHHNTSDKWCIYPMYDYAHPIEDALENVTHSICTLEFEDHRPLYDWVLQEIGFDAPPQQIEFARLNITNTVMSKRYLKALVDNKDVDGWDDPRMPTIAGLRRRGYTPEAIRDFCERIGVAKANSTVDISLLEHCIREDLQSKTEVRMVVLKPLKVTITNYPADKTETLTIENSKEAQTKEQDPAKATNNLYGMREVPFSNELYVERDDFMEFPEKKYFRLFPGNEVRFKGAYFITCQEVIKDASGEVIELKCTYDPATRSGSGFEGRKVKGTIHWVDAKTAVKVKVRTYDYLMIQDDNGENQLNPNSMNVYDAYAESSVADISPGERYQFLRHGYFIADAELTRDDEKVFNRIVDLKSSYKK